MHSARNQMELEEGFMLDAVLKKNVVVLLIIEPKQKSRLCLMEKPSDKSFQLPTVEARVIHSGPTNNRTSLIRVLPHIGFQLSEEIH